MGLLYPFPVDKDESDFVIETKDSLTVKTYGLPYIFWFYALCIISVIGFMFLAIRGPIFKLIDLGDSTDALLGHSLLTFIAIQPLVVLGFLFFEKQITASKNKIFLRYKVFGLKIFSEQFDFQSNCKLTVLHYLSSPNLARLKANPNELGFQNKGYFTLYLEKEDGKKIQLDRHSRKSDLEKLKSLLESVL